MNKETGEYDYSNAEIKKLSEEVNVNLEIGNIDLNNIVYFEKEEKEYISSILDPIYRGEIIKNLDNNKEWIIKVMIPFEAEADYRLWKLIENIDAAPMYKSIGIFEDIKEDIRYEEFELKVVDQELKGNYIIAKINKDNNLPGEAIYSIKK